MVLWPLVFGCALQVSNEFHASANPLLYRVSMCDMTPSELAVVTTKGAAGGLKFVIVGGEQLSFAVWTKLQSFASNSVVVNAYGPTECCVHTMVSSGSREGRGAIAVGRSIENSGVFVSTQAYLRGANVGLGYGNEVKKTREAFLYDKVGNDAKSMQYVTGDKMKFLNDGKGNVYGRADDQVKISGKRVELGAVESVMLACAGVKQCAVLVVEGADGNKSLAAFVVVDISRTTSEQIRAEVNRNAAHHEVPHRIVVVDAIPLTTAGKADRGALRKLLMLAEEVQQDKTLRRQEHHQLTASASVPLSNSLNNALDLFSVVAESFARVLGRNHGIVDVDGVNFFQEGGTSLMAMQLCALLQASSGVNVSVGTVLKLQTVGELAKYLTENTSRSAKDNARQSALSVAGATKKVDCEPQVMYPIYAPVSVSQEGLFVAWKVNRGSEYTVVLGFDTARKVSVPSVRKAVERLCKTHEALRTHFVETRSTVLQVINEEATFDFASCTVDESDEELVVFCNEINGLEIDLSSKPLMKVWAVRRGAGLKDALFFVLPHILYDHGSEERLFGDFASFYLQEEGSIDNFTPAYTNMREYASWEKKMLQERGEELKEFWMKALGGARPTKIPGWRRSGGPVSNVKYCRRRFLPDVSKSLQAVCQKNNWRPIALFHASLALFLCRETAGADAVVSVAVSQRDNAAFRSAVGYLMNLVKIRYVCDLSRDRKTFVDECQQRLVEAIDHSQYPWPMIARACGFVEDEETVDVTFDVVPAFPADDAVTQVMKEGICGGQLSQNTIQFEGSVEDGLYLGYRDENFSNWDAPLRIMDGVMEIASQSFLMKDISSVRGLALQEEEWGTGPTVVGAMPTTFQGVVSKYMKTKHESKMVDLSGVTRGAKAGDVVGLHMRRSEMLVWLTYSVVAHGMAFLPLDSSLSLGVVKERAEVAGTKVICLHLPLDVSFNSAFAKMLRYRSPVGIFVDVLAQDTSFLSFSSGSTGKSKCVSLKHSSILFQFNFLRTCSWQVTLLDENLWHSSISFDQFVVDLCWIVFFSLNVLVVGGAEFVHEVLKMCSMAFFVPSQLQIVHTTLGEKLKLIFCAGESLSRTLANVVRPQIRLWNLYGPTETSVSVCYFHVNREKSTIPCIGRSHPNVTLLLREGVLDIGGPCVGKGYKTMHQFSRKAFQYDRHQNDGAQKVYNSGDRAIFLESGDLNYLGRVDDQVKNQRTARGAGSGRERRAVVQRSDTVRGCCGGRCRGQQVAGSVCGVGRKQDERGRDSSRSESQGGATRSTSQSCAGRCNSADDCRQDRQDGAAVVAGC